MAVDRTMSAKTWEQIDERLHKITRNAVELTKISGAKKLANDIYGDADMCIALIRNLAMEIGMEDGSFGR